MKKCLLFGLFALLPYDAMGATEYFISSTGTDAGQCTRTAPCATLGFVDGLVVGGDTITWKYGLYDGGGSGSFFSIGANTFVAHASAPITIRGEPWPTGTGVFTATNSVIVSSYSTAMNIDRSSDIIVSNFIIKNSFNSSIALTATNRIRIKNVHIKNGVKPTSTYGPVVQFADLDLTLGSDYILFENCTVDGTGRYQIINGGTAGFSEWNIMRGNLFRWSQHNSGQPHAGMAQYGVASGGVEGARNAFIFNNIGVDFNSSTHSLVEDLYGAFYNPQSPSNINYYRNIAFNIPDREGFLLMENAVASNIQVYDCIAAYAGSASGNHPAFHMNNAGSSVTIKNSMSYRSNNKGFGLTNGPLNITYKQNVSYRDEQISDNANSSSTLMACFPSSAAVGSNPITTEPNFVAITSAVPNLVGRGLEGESVGIRSFAMLGNPGTIYGEPGWNVETSSTMCDIPDQLAIKSLWAEADASGWDADTSNNNQRGWAGSSFTLVMDYINNQSGYCASIAGTGGQQGGGGGSTPSPTANGFRGSFRIQGNMSYGKP